MGVQDCLGAGGEGWKGRRWRDRGREKGSWGRQMMREGLRVEGLDLRVEG